MTSEERKAIRYQRRVEKRKLKKKENYERDNKYMTYKEPTYTYEKVFSYNHLYRAYLKCLRGVGWKGTVQAFKHNVTICLSQLYDELMNNKFRSGRFFEFTIMERGKVRHIKSVGIKERVVQRCLCDNFLVPILSRYLVYDNCACQKGKGFHFAIKRCKRHLYEYYKRYRTNDGYILQWDFSKYFDNISHKKLIEEISRLVDDERLLNFIIRLINDFKGDKGLGLGSQISQISALFFPTLLDHYFKEKIGCKCYARYMDDGYIISNSKEELKRCKEELLVICNKLGIIINPKKTNINKLSNGFTYLKARFYMTKEGKVIIKPNKKSIGRNRRKLKNLEEIENIKVETIVTSIKGYLKHFNSYHTIKNLEMRKTK